MCYLLRMLLIEEVDDTEHNMCYYFISKVYRFSPNDKLYSFLLHYQYV